ncbi:MAG: ATP-binding cassette domain-containing protein [Alphaproteobacteria bacterium]|nr:ATP-binding cassette domain-containing protein [Alphaproteobacteria bacterium]
MSESIKLVNISKNYSNIKAVDNFNFVAKRGEIIALLGPNGAGKSTLMNMITGFLAPTSGKIFVDGLDIAQYPEKAKEKIGFLPEGSPIYSDMSVNMFLKYMADIRGVGKKEIKKSIELANIENVLHQKIETLSKGYLRRVGFAQSVLSNPDILLLDEPTDGLDPNQKTHMRNLIAKMGKNKTIIISTHLLDEAQTVCNRIVLINKGKIMADGTAEDILKQTKTRTLEKAFAKLTISKTRGE